MDKIDSLDIPLVIEGSREVLIAPLPVDLTIRIKQSINSLFPLLLAGNHSAGYISRTEEKKKFRSFLFVDQATPRFELGKKDLQSPALPLGHVAKMIQNR